MNKKFKLILIVFGIIICLWIIGRVTNMLQWYSSPTNSNYPSIKKGARFFASNLVRPKRFNFICYYATTPEFGKQIWTHRLCGLEGDKIEIRNGNLFVNNVYVDSLFSLAHDYILPANEMDKVNAFEKIDESFIQSFSSDSNIIFLSDKTIVTHFKKIRRQILAKEYIDKFILKQYSEPWNQDNFGPLIVPGGKYFVLGDNRMNSNDSRYIGFIDKSNYVATVLGR